MEIGTITVDGRQIGIVTIGYGTPDTTAPLLSGGDMPAAIRGDPGGDVGGGARRRHAPGRYGDQDRGGHQGTRHEGANVRDRVKSLREGPVTLGKGDDPRGMESHIRSEAAKHGVDPDTAVRVAKSEGLRDFSGDKGTSFGAFQLHKRGGLGDEFQKETGLDPADPANERATISWALRNVGRTGWEPYHGAARVGIGHRQGIGGASTAPSEEGTATPGRGSANYMRGQHGAAGENLTVIQTPSGKPVTVHKDAAGAFSGFLADLEGSGYKIDSIGGYNQRNISGSNRLSQHAYGNALDINPRQNPQHGGTNLPRNISDMAAKHGLTWGGDWSARSRDPMHFEWTGMAPRKQSKAAEDKPFDPETMAP